MILLAVIGAVMFRIASTHFGIGIAVAIIVIGLCFAIAWKLDNAERNQGQGRAEE